MRKVFCRRSLAVAFLALASLGVGLFAQNKFGKPKSVIHVVTVSWKEGTTPAQIKAALDGVEKMAANYPGIKNVWLRSIKVQGGRTHAFVMEFESEDALKKYTDSPAQLEWYKVYMPIREESTTHDITN
jgi:antibiotic biosynthesis monooxygenase (ABM) superfamily enzyme